MDTDKSVIVHFRRRSMLVNPLERLLVRVSRNLGTLSRGTSKEAFFHAKSGSGLDFSSNLAYDLCEVKKETTVLRVRSPFSMTSRGNSNV